MRTVLNSLTVLLLFVACLSSCKDYSEDLEELGERISKIERDTVTIVKDVSFYEKIVKTIYSHKGIVNLAFNSEEDCYILYFEGGDSLILRDGQKGTDGKPILADCIGVTKGADGKTYWTVNGEVMTDSNGNPVEIFVPEGKSGGSVDVTKMSVPIVRVDPTTGNWQYTTYTFYDGSSWKVIPDAPESMWKDLGVVATGEDGPQGPQGPEGPSGTLDYDLFTSIYTYDSDSDGVDDCLVLIMKEDGNIYYIKMIN